MDRQILSLCVALGIGLAIGLERERSQARPGEDVPAGLRTFAIAAFSGAVAALLPVPLLLPVLILATAALAVAAYRRGSVTDPGLTSEFALVLTVLLGALAVSATELAAGIAAVVVALLHAKAYMHRLARETLSQDEVNDALLLGIAALVIWPLLPDRYLGLFEAWNPHRLWLVVLMVMATGAMGRACARWMGERVSLPLVGFLAGFASSLATVGAMVTMAGNSPRRARAPLAAALFSGVATFVQMMLVLAATSIATWRALALPLLTGLLVTLVFAIFWLWRCLREPAQETPASHASKLFDWRAAGIFAILVATLQLVGAVVEVWLGEAALIAISAGAGLADAHAVATSVGALVATGRLETGAAAMPVLAGLSTNAVAKIGAARAGGSPWFAGQVGIGLLAAMAAAWLTALGLPGIS